jgi:hypothetical protein
VLAVGCILTLTPALFFRWFALRPTSKTSEMLATDKPALGLSKGVSVP